MQTGNAVHLAGELTDHLLNILDLAQEVSLGESGWSWLDILSVLSRSVWVCRAIEALL